MKRVNMRKYRTQELIGCVRRELGQRKRVYGRMVAESRMDAETAEREIGMMEEILEMLEDKEQLKLF
jgi:hypothetical protein